MKQYILLLVLMVMGAGIHAYAEDVNPVKEGNVISGHVAVSYTHLDVYKRQQKSLIIIKSVCIILLFF